MKVLPQRRADEFARLLETGGHTDDPVTAPLLTVVDALAEVPVTPGPRPEFRTALRQRLVAVAAVQAANPVVDRPLARVRAAGTTWAFQRRLVAVGAGAAVVTAVTGVAVGASRSLPGQPLYDVKRSAEGFQLATTFGTEDRGKRHLQFARERLAEVSALADRNSSLGPVFGSHLLAAAAVPDQGRAALIADTLHDMDVETRAGANDLFVAYRDSGTREPLSALNAFTVRQYSELHALVGSLPATVRPQALGSLSLLNLVATDTVTLVRGAASTPGSSSTPTPGVSTPAVTPTTGRPTPSTTPTTTRSRTSAPSSPSSGPAPLPTPSVPTIPSIPVTPPTLGPLPTSVPTLDVTGLLSGH